MIRYQQYTPKQQNKCSEITKEWRRKWYKWKHRRHSRNHTWAIFTQVACKLGFKLSFLSKSSMKMFSWMASPSKKNPHYSQLSLLKPHFFPSSHFFTDFLFFSQRLPLIFIWILPLLKIASIFCFSEIPHLFPIQRNPWKSGLYSFPMQFQKIISFPLVPTYTFSHSPFLFLSHHFSNSPAHAQLIECILEKMMCTQMVMHGHVKVGPRFFYLFFGLIK